MKQLDMIVVGLGHQSIEDHLPAINQIQQINLVGVTDIDLLMSKQIGEDYDVPYAANVSDLLKKLNTKPKAALIAVPHHQYLPIIKVLALNNIHIIKEKPYAVNSKEAVEIQKIINENGVSLHVTLQRRYNPIYVTFNQLLKRIGKVHSIEARYTMNIERLDDGWRAIKASAGGGALIDMGYHYIDLINWYFGLPHSVSCRMTLGNREGQTYDVEDTAFLDFTYNNTKNAEEKTLGSLIVSRVYPEKDELLVAYGSKGSVRIQRGIVCRRDLDGNIVEALERKEPGWPSAIIDQLEQFSSEIIANNNNGKIEKKHIAHTAFIEAAYKSAETGVPVNPHDLYKNMLKGISNK